MMEYLFKRDTYYDVFAQFIFSVAIHHIFINFKYGK